MISKLIMLVCFLGVGLTSHAVERVLQIEHPTEVAAGTTVTVVLKASTNAGGGEQVGLFHADVSRDGGKTWEGLYYETNPGAAVRVERPLVAGAAGSTLKVRARVAFRGGAAGDVDSSGAAIRWNESWGTWEEPVGRQVTIRIR